MLLQIDTRYNTITIENSHIGDLNNCVAKNEYNCPISKRLTNYLDIVNSECKLKGSIP